MHYMYTVYLFDVMFGDGLGCWHVLRCHNVIKSSIGNIYQALAVVVLKHSAHEISQLWY